MLDLITLDVFKEEALEGLNVSLADAHLIDEVLGDGLLELVVGGCHREQPQHDVFNTNHN